MTTAVTSTLSRDNRVLKICVSGRFDFHLRDSFSASYNKVSDSVREVSLDFQHLGYMDSSALGMLLYMNIYFCEQVEVTINNCRPMIKELLLLARFDKKFIVN